MFHYFQPSSTARDLKIVKSCSRSGQSICYELKIMQPENKHYFQVGFQVAIVAGMALHASLNCIHDGEDGEHLSAEK